MYESLLTESEIFLKKKKAAYPSDGIAAESAIDVVLCQEFRILWQQGNHCSLIKDARRDR